jgi:hypothetical protein
MSKSRQPETTNDLDDEDLAVFERLAERYDEGDPVGDACRAVLQSNREANS